MGDSNAGAMCDKLIASRGGAQTSASDGELKVAGESLSAHMEVEEIRCFVKGRVQGVFYRDFVVKHARHLVLTGYVRNTPDFMVEVLAQGYSDKLEKFIEYLRKGPFLAKVSDVSVEWRKPSEQLKTFDIVF